MAFYFFTTVFFPSVNFIQLLWKEPLFLGHHMVAWCLARNMLGVGEISLVVIVFYRLFRSVWHSYVEYLLCIKSWNSSLSFQQLPCLNLLHSCSPIRCPDPVTRYELRDQGVFGYRRGSVSDSSSGEIWRIFWKFSGSPRIKMAA